MPHYSLLLSFIAPAFSQSSTKIATDSLSGHQLVYPEYPECRQLNHSLMVDLVSMSPNKTVYFERLRQYTPLTKGEYPSASHMRLPSALFIGDSIVLEISQRYKTISPQSNSTFRVNVAPTAENLHDTLNSIAHSNHIVFVGGNALHMLTRRRNIFKIFESHVNRVRRVLEKLKWFQQQGRKVIYVGSITVDTQLMLPPAKGDWDDFHDFSLLEIWSKKDKELCAEYDIPFFDSVALVRQCPGVRCDGMHFGSSFINGSRGGDWGCYPSIHLWDRFLIAFVKMYCS
jgi:hypothetical protein